MLGSHETPIFARVSWKRWQINSVGLSAISVSDSFPCRHNSSADLIFVALDAKSTNGNSTSASHSRTGLRLSGISEITTSS
jgi:hypothetical protein